MSLPFTPELAYIGPGAGFAFLGSFLTLLGGLLLGLISVFLWPFRMALRAFRGQQGYKHAKVKKLIFLGLDGLDPGLAERYMAEGKLPNLSRLREQGGFHRLRTTFPRSFAGRLVDVRHRRQPGPAQHVRFSEPQPAIVHAGAFLHAGARSRARPQTRQVPHPA